MSGSHVAVADSRAGVSGSCVAVKVPAQGTRGLGGGNEGSIRARSPLGAGSDEGCRWRDHVRDRACERRSRGVQRRTPVTSTVRLGDSPARVGRVIGTRVALTVLCWSGHERSEGDQRCA